MAAIDLIDFYEHLIYPIEHELGEWKTVVWDENTKNFAIPNGSQGLSLG